jgi:hypothetical protein
MPGIMKCEGLSIIAMASHSVTRFAVLSCLFFSSLNAEKVDANDIFSERCPKSEARLLAVTVFRFLAVVYM